MKIGFLLESIGLSGGVNVVFEYASRLKKYGIDVVIITPQKFSINSYSWFPDYKELNVVSDEEALVLDFDVLFATFWKTVFRLYKFKAKKYAYYVQSIENRFFKSKEEEYYNFCELTYLLNLDTITEATWIQKYFKDNYDRDVHLVRNGIRKENYNEERVIEKRPEKGIRILVEGNLDQWFKNIRRTIEICNKSDCKDIWLLTSSKVDKIDGVSRVFSQVNVKDVAPIYSSCDVLVKLSYVEGMFGPPLEMFHCGGTAIVYNVSGCEEYMVNGVNSIIVEKDDENGVINAINKLNKDKELLNNLKENALKTAITWRNWEESAKEYSDVVNGLNDKNNIRINEQLVVISKIWEKYEENKTKSDLLSGSRMLKLYLNLKGIKLN